MRSHQPRALQRSPHQLRAIEPRAAQVEPAQVSADEKADLIAFLQTLDGAAVDPALLVNTAR